MIINFDQTPESFFRLSENALDQKDLKKALRYAEKALEGKSCAAYRLHLAEIYCQMERFKDAMDLVLLTLARGCDLKSEAYDIMLRATSGAGKMYDSFFYVMGKAKIEGDDETLDAVDDAMGGFMEYLSEHKDKPNLFVVGKKEKTDYAREMDRASGFYHAHQFELAKEKALSVPEDSEFYEDAQDLALRAAVHLEDRSLASSIASAKLRRVPKDGFAAYVMVVFCEDHAYVSYLENVSDLPQDLYFAVVAADRAQSYDLSVSLAERLMKAAPYASESYFVAAGAYLNAGDKERSEDVLKSLFSLYTGYPSALIMRQWKLRDRVDLLFGGTIPEEVCRGMANYVRRYARSAGVFEERFLTDKDFRAAIRLLFEEEQTEIVGRVGAMLEEINAPKILRFFEEMLTSTRIENGVKQEIMSKLIQKKHKGKLAYTMSAVLSKMDCKKPAAYEKYEESLRFAYAEALAFTTCMFDHPCGKELADLIDSRFAWNDYKLRFPPLPLAAALSCVILEKNDIPFPRTEQADVAESITQNFFNLAKWEIAEMKKMLSFLR